jgi:hypothetical protein
MLVTRVALKMTSSAPRWTGHLVGPPRNCRRSPETPVSAPKDGCPRRDAKARPRGGDEQGLSCRTCGLPITSWAHARAVDGHSVHRRSNPAGIAFEFGCFATAPGAVPVGGATGEHTWFAGCIWCLALCRGCGSHLGWLFAGPGDSFFGLILGRLVEDREGKGTQ